MKRLIGLVVMCALAAPAAAERRPVRVVKDIAYRAAVSGADGEGRLDLDLPQGKRQQNEEFEREVRKAGNARVGIVRISGRTHRSILGQLKDEDDPASNTIIAFVNGTNHAK